MQYKNDLAESFFLREEERKKEKIEAIKLGCDSQSSDLTSDLNFPLILDFYVLLCIMICAMEYDSYISRIFYVFSHYKLFCVDRNYGFTVYSNSLV